MGEANSLFVPEWVPVGAQRYLAHTEAGRSIRDLARGAGCHASTILRQIRRVEMRRDDPLVDAALQKLAATHFAPSPTGKASQRATRYGFGNHDMKVNAQQAEEAELDHSFDQNALRVLRRLCESGALLAVAENMDKAVVVRDDGDGGNTRTAVVECSVAQALALKEWISCDKPGRISRYRITNSGRAALSHLLAESENQARKTQDNGMAEAQAQFSGAAAVTKASADPQDRRRRVRYGAAESPLIALARRKDRDGKPFLDDALVRAGERLREDFELSQMGPNVTQNWDSFLTAGAQTGKTCSSGIGNSSSMARDNVARAMAHLGPELSDIVLRCCCFLEGLEQAEKKMGWSARSGKIVLRIALFRLNQFYENEQGANRMIG